MEGEYKVTWDITPAEGASIEGETTAAEGESYTFRVVPSENYKISRVTVNEEEKNLAAEVEPAEYIVEAVTADIHITVDAEKIVEEESTECAVTYEVKPSEGAVVEGPEKVEKGETLSFTVTPAEEKEILKVTVNDEVLSPVEEEATAEENAEEEAKAFNYVYENVSEDLTVKIELNGAEEELVKLTATADDGAEITVSGTAKALEGVAKVTAVKITDEAKLEALLASINEQLSDSVMEAKDLVAYDITLLNADGDEVQPSEEVTVTIVSPEIPADGDDVMAFHAKEVGGEENFDVELKEDASIDNSNGVLEMTTESFSVFGRSVLRAGESVARIGDTEYTDLAEAINAAKGGDTIELLADCEIKDQCITIKDKNLTITGNFEIDTVDAGFYLLNTNLTFVGCTISETGKGVDPDGGENYWVWRVDSTSIVTLTNKTKFIASNIQGGVIYFSPGAQMNVYNNSTFMIEKSSYTSIMGENSNDGKINVSNKSEFTISNSSINGMTGSGITVNDSNISLINCRNQGFVKGDFILENGATANVSGNYTGINLWGGDSLVVNSGTSLTLNNNGSRALVTQGSKQTTVTVKEGGTLIAQKNGGAWYASDPESKYYANKGAITIGVFGWYQPWNQILLYRNDVATFEDGANVDISNNYIRGITNYGTMYIGNGTNITNNVMLKDGETEADRRVATGGGVYNGNKMTIANGVSLYNNHANTEADDIYNEEGATITFPATGNGWRLDGDPDCTDAIDGWYDDSIADGRWEAHGDPLHMEVYTGYGSAVTELLTLKAAHGVITPPPTPTPTPDPDPDPTPTTTTTTTTTTTSVLGTTAAPAVGVLGQAAAPEVGVLGDAAGPGTGDTTPIGVWLALVAAATAILVGFVVVSNKKKSKRR